MMHRLLALLFSAFCLTVCWAQQRRLDFQDAPLARVLAQIDELYPSARIHFILDEVTPYIVTKSITCDDVSEALNQVLADLPFVISTEGCDLFVNYTESIPNETRNPADAIRSYCLQEVFVFKQLGDLFVNDDNYVIDLSNSDLKYRGTAIDVISYLPGLSYNAGQILNYNSTSPVIYIDDVEVSNVSELYSLRSEEISRVAYVESANSTYHSDNGRLIKIYTVKSDKGWNVQAQSAATVGHKISHSGQVNLSRNTNRFVLNASVNYQQNNGYQEHKTSDFDITLTPHITTVGTNLQMSYRINPHHVIGAKYNLTDITNRVLYWSRAFGMRAPFDADNIAGLESWEESDWSLDYSPRHDLRCYYMGQVAKCHIRLDLGYYSDAMKIIQQEMLLDNQNNSQSGQRINGIDNEFWTERLDIALPLGQMNIHVGNEYTLTSRQDTYLRQFWDVARMGIDRTEQQSALFALVDWRWHGLNLQAGIRSEHLHTTSHQATEKMVRKRTYLLPFTDIRLPFDNSEIGFAYSLRTQRPTYDQLNGYTRFNQYMLFISGNPNLEPSKHHIFGLKYRNSDLHVNINYKYMTDYLASIISFDGNVYSQQYTNLSSSHELMATVSYSPHTERWNPIFSSTILHQDVDLTFSDGSHRRLNHPIWHLDVHSPYRLTRHSQLWVDGHYHTSGHIGSTLQGATGTLHVGFSYQFDHWNISLHADDLLKTGTTSFHSYGQALDYYHSSYSDTQSISLSLHYHLK